MKKTTKELFKEIEKMGEKIKGSATLPANASKLDKEKYKLCREFVIFVNKHKLTHGELARRLEISRTRVTEILNYRIGRLSLDTLFSLLGKINIKAEIRIAA